MSRLDHSLERKLAYYVGMGMLVFSLIAGAFSYRLEYQNQLDQEQAFYLQLVSTVRAQAEVSAFARNAEIAQELFAGLLSNPSILGVRIESTEGFHEEKASVKNIDFSKATKTPLYSPINGRQQIGLISLVKNDEKVAQDAARKALSLTLLLILQILIATALIFGVFRQVMGKPIAELADRVSAIRPGNGVRLPIKQQHEHDEIGFLSRCANNLIEAAEESLREYGKAKEAAESKSQQVSNLLDNSGQGFLSFSDDLAVDAEYSRECESIFHKNIVGNFLPDLLYPEDAGERAYLTKNLSRVFAYGDNESRREAYLGLLPTEYHLLERYYEAEYRFLGERIMLILTDVSDEKALQEKIQQERQRIDFLVNAMENRNDLLDTLDAWRQFQTEVLPALTSSTAQPQASLIEIHRQIHTYKGLFAQEGLPTMPRTLHELEDVLAHLIETKFKTKENVSLDELRAALTQIDLAGPLEADLSLLREKLGAHFFAAGKLIQIPATAVDQIEADALAVIDIRSSNGKKLLDSIHGLRYQPLSTLLEPHFTASAMLATRLNRELMPVRYEGEDILVDPRVLAPFCKSLMHVFRNCVDHGIEDPDVRLSVGKNEVGRIYCRVEQQGERILLCIGDDGQGINPDVIRAKAIEKGIISAEAATALSDNNAQHLIFTDGLSTREQVTEISGRGIGLAATLQELDKLTGTVEIISTPGQGAEFRFSLPLTLPQWTSVIAGAGILPVKQGSAHPT